MDKILKVLEGVELNEEQVAAFDEFFAEFTEKIKDETSEVYQEELDKLEEKVKVLAESNEVTDAKYSPENVEKAFELYKEDIDKEHAEEVDSLRDEMSNQLAETVQSVYEDIEGRAKADLASSREMKALNLIKEALAPLMVSDETLLQEVNSLQEELSTLKADKDEMTREKTINALLEDIPAEFSDFVRDFISKGETEEAIYEHYETILPIIEMKIKNINEEEETEEFDEEEIEEVIEDDEVVEDDIEDAIAENVIFQTDTSEQEIVTEDVQEEQINDKDLTEEDMLRVLYSNYARPHRL